MSSKTAYDSEQIADRLHSAAIHLLRRLRRTDDQSGMSAARLSLLSVLVFAGDKTLGELARLEQVQPPTITKLIQALEQEELVVRKAHPGDKRAVTIRATAKGRRILNNARQLRIQHLTTLMNNLNHDEVETLAAAAALIERLAAA